MYTRSYNATRFGAVDSAAYGYANKADNWELVAQYQFDFGLRPSLAFVSSRGSDIEGYGSQNLKNMSTWVRPITSTKTCRPMLITRLTCWTTTTSPMRPVSTPTTSLRWLVYQF